MAKINGAKMNPERKIAFKNLNVKNDKRLILCLDGGGMRGILTIQLLVSFYCNPLFAQTPVDVAETTLKVGMMGEEFFYYKTCKSYLFEDNHDLNSLISFCWSIIPF